MRALCPMLTFVRGNNLYSSIFFNFHQWVCGFSNLWWAFFAVVLCKLEHGDQYSVQKYDIAIRYRLILGRVLSHWRIKKQSSRLSRFEARHVLWDISSLYLGTRISHFWYESICSKKFRCSYVILIFSDISWNFWSCELIHCFQRQ